MKLPTLLALALLAGVSSPLVAEQKPLRVLVVAGGCCHDYANQKEILKKGIEARVNATVEVAYDATKSTKPVFELYKSPDWGKNFDVVVHDECAADITDQAYVANIVNAHKNGLPAVNLHCAMHSYRWGNFKQPVKAGDDNASWYEMLGLQSTGHGPQQPIAITFTDKAHPVTTGLADWTTVNEELYNNVQVLTAKTLATGLQKVPEKKDKKGKVTPASEATAIVAWTNEFGPKKTRIFSTTIGHNNATVEDARYLDLVARAVLWSAGKLEADGKPSAGFGK
ncbi:MAG: ThuA domain-containing protein [Opitutales bacterium]|jgi:type 1 glutamine amidotransferase